MRKIEIENINISDQTKCFFIAEIGHNHQGNLEQCKQMIFAAKKSGASAVKLQKRDNKHLFTKKYYSEKYDSINAYGPTYGLHREALEFSESEFKELQNYAKKIGIIFFATPFDIKSADLLIDMDVPAYKIASTDITNHILIKHIAKANRPIIISTGAATLKEINQAVEIVLNYHEKIAILQCTAIYPPNDEEINLLSIQSFRKLFPNLVIGYSGHDIGTSVSIAAFALGARIIEKHFTLDKTLKGNDHKLSLDPQELQFLINELTKLHKALGDGNKCIYDSERNTIIKMGKKLVASSNLNLGHIINEYDIDIKSPGDGIHPGFLKEIIGKKLNKAMQKEEDFSFDSLKKV